MKTCKSCGRMTLIGTAICPNCGNNTFYESNLAPQYLEDEYPACYFCGQRVNDAQYCYGCQSYVCNNCDQTHVIGKHDVSEHRMNKHWICYVEGSDGGKRYRHQTLQSAQTEAERLANLSYNIGKKVYIYEYKGDCKTEITPVKWNIPY